MDAADNISQNGNAKLWSTIISLNIGCSNAILKAKCLIQPLFDKGNKESISSVSTLALRNLQASFHRIQHAR
ncbi:hypothetical protein LguiA_015400 [Lonicera macranthoides]